MQLRDVFRRNLKGAVRQIDSFEQEVCSRLWEGRVLCAGMYGHKKSQIYKNNEKKKLKDNSKINRKPMQDGFM